MFEKYLDLQRQHYFAIPPKFDPEQGITIFEPENQGFGHWVGGHNIVYDEVSEQYFLFGRVRNPSERGHKCFIAESEDGEQFTLLWEATKEQLGASSIEVGSLIKDPNTQQWRLYLSYEKKNGPWRVDILEADQPRDFTIEHHRTVFNPSDYGVEFIKDPKIYIIGGLYHAFVNVNARDKWFEDENGLRHPLGEDATALLTSPDGIYFRNFQYIFEPKRGVPDEWGHFRARVNSIIYIPPVYIGFIDMGTTAYDTYEEWCGVAISHDLEKWKRVTTNEPWVTSKYGCIRYVDAMIVKNEIWYYYEYTREDASHELRVNKVRI